MRIETDKGHWRAPKADVDQDVTDRRINSVWGSCGGACAWRRANRGFRALRVPDDVDLPYEVRVVIPHRHRPAAG